MTAVTERKLPREIFEHMKTVLIGQVRYYVNTISLFAGSLNSLNVGNYRRTGWT